MKQKVYLIRRHKLNIVALMSTALFVRVRKALMVGYSLIMMYRWYINQVLHILLRLVNAFPRIGDNLFTLAFGDSGHGCVASAGTTFSDICAFRKRTTPPRSHYMPAFLLALTIGFIIVYKTKGPLRKSFRLLKSVHSRFFQFDN